MFDSRELFPWTGDHQEGQPPHSDDIDADPRGRAAASLRVSDIRRQSWWRLPFFLMAIFVVVVGSRLVYLQIVQGAELRERAEHNRVRVQILPAPRGSIVDRNGVSIAENAPNFSILAIPADLPSASDALGQLVRKLSAATEIPEPELAEKIQNVPTGSSAPVILQEHLSYDQALRLMVITNQLSGISVQSVPTRTYPLGPAAATVIGYTGIVSQADLDKRSDVHPQSRVGKSGLELEFDSTLAGIDGRREVERDVRNQRLEVLHEYEPQAGQSIQLGLDAQLQITVHEELSRMLRQSPGTAAAAVALDPRSGEIRAMASLPEYDNNWFVSGEHNEEVNATLTNERQPLLNRAIAGQYPSGSIIKPLIGSAALAENIVTPSTAILSTGGIRIGVDNFPDWQSGGHGLTNLARAIADSVNTYFYTVGGGHTDRSGLGVDRIVEYLQRFGWGARLQIDLPGEAPGLLPTTAWREQQRPSPWRLGDTYHLSIGQGDLSVTPLQVATAVAALANNGTVYRPHLATAVIAPDGEIVKEIQPRVLQTLGIAAHDLAAVREGMRLGVTDGSSRALQNLPVAVAGKTGTAQFGNEGKTHAWHVGFAPFENPELVIAVIVEGGGEGHAAALPVTRAAFASYFQPAE